MIMPNNQGNVLWKLPSQTCSSLEDDFDDDFIKQFAVIHTLLTVRYNINGVLIQTTSSFYYATQF